VFLFHRRLALAAICLAMVLVAAAACSKATSSERPDPPLDVQVAQVEQRDVPIFEEWIGTLDGMVDANIKAQVTGYLLKQEYKEGSFVRKGQLLFQIDPRPFQAALDQARGQLAQADGQMAQAKALLAQAEAQLAKAQADQRRTQLDVDRYTPLAQQEAVTQQDLDNAVQNNLSAQAQVKAATAGIETAKAQIVATTALVQSADAAVETATLNLAFTRLTSPIDGIAGMVQQQVGDLVGPSSGPVTTVSTVDPIRAYFTVSEQEYLQFTKQFRGPAGPQAGMQSLRLQLILADGSTYPRSGEFYFADREVNQNTGAIRLAALFPNPGNLLRPGQYGRVRAAVRTERGALLAPQRAVSELQGAYQVAVLDNQNRVNIRNVIVGDRVGTLWIIREGLHPGERVVAEGVQKVRPGTQVTPRPYGPASSETRIP